MPTTTLHMPSKLLRALDTLAARKKVTRNNLVVEACERLVQQNRGKWPAGFLQAAHLSTKDRTDLEAAAKTLERAVLRARRSRPG